MKKMYIRSTGFLVLALLIAACSSPSASPAPAEAKPAEPALSGNVDIQMKDFAFNPKGADNKSWNQSHLD